MRVEHQLERIVIVPRNGYVNRLQAWASTEILGARLSVPVRMLWEPEPVAPASANDLFADELVARTCLTTEEVTRLLGVSHEQVPRYLTALPDRQVLVLAGHDRGEQVFMPELAARLGKQPWLTQLVIIAGGRFHLGSNETEFNNARHDFYSRIVWHPSITHRTQHLSANRPPYLGLHIRGTDRSIDAPSQRAIRQALLDLKQRSGITSLFIAADTGASRQQWQRISRTLGFEPWVTDEHTFDRAQIEAGQDAMVDWLILSRSSGSVYSATSSFGEEAAVASRAYVRGRPLRAGLLRRSARRGSELVHDVVTYPSRR